MTNPKVVSPTHLPDSECRMGPSVGGVGASLGSLTVNIESFICNKSLQKGFYLKHIDSWQVEPPCSASLRSSSSSLAKSEASGLSDSPVPSSALKSNIRLSSATTKKVSSPCFPPHGSLCWQLIKVSPNIEPSTNSYQSEKGSTTP